LLRYRYTHDNQRYLKYTENTVKVKGKTTTQIIAEERYSGTYHQVNLANQKRA